MATAPWATSVQQMASTSAVHGVHVQQTPASTQQQMAMISPEIRYEDGTHNPICKPEGADDISGGWDRSKARLSNHSAMGLKGGLTCTGFKKLLYNQAQLSLAIRQIDADGASARANDAEIKAAASAVQAAESATLAGSAAEVAASAQPLLEALHRMEGRLTAMEGRLSAIELKQDVAASGCCVLM